MATLTFSQDDRHPSQPDGLGGAGEAGAGPFLVLTDQTLTEAKSAEPGGQPPTSNTGVGFGPFLNRLACLSRPIQPGDRIMVNRLTGETRPMRCQRNGCPDCIGTNSWRRSLAVQYVEPTHELTLTTTDLHNTANPWPQVQDRLRVLRQAAKRDHVDLGGFGTFVEQGSAHGMTHAHIVVKDGHRLDFDWLRHRIQTAGFAGRFTYSQIKNESGFASYVGKGFAGYAVKGYSADAEDALRLNAGRVGHFSRGFFPDGVRRAEVQSLAAFHEQATEESPWFFTIQT